MTQIRFPTVQALAHSQCCHYRVDDTDMITLAYHEAFVNDMRNLYQDDLTWAKQTAAKHGIDLDTLADNDPEYRAKWRTP